MASEWRRQGEGERPFSGRPEKLRPRRPACEPRPPPHIRPYLRCCEPRGALNDAGEIVGDYSDSTPPLKHCCSGPLDLAQANVDLHGFLLSGGVFTKIDVPTLLRPRLLGSTGSVILWASTSTQTALSMATCGLRKTTIRFVQPPPTA